MGLQVKGNVKTATLSAVVTRADGTVEDYGAIGFQHRNPVINFIGNAWIRIKRRLKR